VERILQPANGEKMTALAVLLRVAQRYPIIVILRVAQRITPYCHPERRVSGVEGSCTSTQKILHSASLHSE